MIWRAWINVYSRKVGHKGNLSTTNKAVAAVHCTRHRVYVRQWLVLLHAEFHNQQKPGSNDA